MPIFLKQEQSLPICDTAARSAGAMKTKGKNRREEVRDVAARLCCLYQCWPFSELPLCPVRSNGRGKKIISGLP